MVEGLIVWLLHVLLVLGLQHLPTHQETNINAKAKHTKHRVISPIVVFFCDPFVLKLKHSM